MAFLFKPKFRETLPSNQVEKNTDPGFWETNKTSEVNQNIEIVKEDVNDRTNRKSISNIVVNNDTSPDDLLHSIKEIAKEEKRRWDRITINYVVNGSVRKQLEIDREHAVKITEEVAVLYEFLEYVLGYGDID